MSDGFFVLHRDLPREGPGLPADVLWALDVAGTLGVARICDAACGPGADLVTLAAALPGAELVGIDGQAHFLAQARGRVPDRVRLVQGEMAALPGVFDLIWCAGAMYFLGVTEGLRGWRGHLSKGGRVAFSEPVFVQDPVSETVRAFWKDDPYVTGMAGIRERIAAAGYRILGERLIIGAAWEAYYGPMEARLAALLAAGEMGAALTAAAEEIALWRAGRDEIAYALFVVEPEGVAG